MSERPIGDMKQGLTGSRPKLSILSRDPITHETRVREYGADKYARGNYYGPPPPTVSQEERVLGYIDAAMRHLTRVADAVNRAMGTGGSVRAALATIDDDGGGKYPPSNLPDLSHALTSLSIGIQCACDAGILPKDPGQPWKAGLVTEAGLPQKDDPAAERARVAALGKGSEIGELAALECLIHGASMDEVERLFGKIAAARAAIARANASKPSERNAELVSARVAGGAYDVVYTDGAMDEEVPTAIDSETTDRMSAPSPAELDDMRRQAAEAALIRRAQDLEPQRFVQTNHSDPGARDAYTALAKAKVIP